MSLFIFNYTKKNFFLEEEKHDARRKTVPGSIQQNRKSEVEKIDEADEPSF